MSLIRKINQLGWRYSLAIAFSRVVPPWLFRCRRFVIFELDPTAIDSQLQTASTSPVVGAQSPATKEKITIQRCTTESETMSAEELTFFRRTMSTGNLQAVLATVAAQPAAGCWIATQQFDESELGIRVSLDPHQSWIFAAMVAKEFRRRGIYSQILHFVTRQSSDHENKQWLVAVNPNNIGSFQIHRRSATRLCGTVFAMRFFRTSFCWTRGTIQRDRGCSWNSTKRPITIRVG